MKIKLLLTSLFLITSGQVLSSCEIPTEVRNMVGTLCPGRSVAAGIHSPQGIVRIEIVRSKDRSMICYETIHTDGSRCARMCPRDTSK